MKTLEETVAGIPCLVEVLSCVVVPPHSGSPHTCDSDVDYYGYEEMDYVICDRRGRHASWLERKLTDADRSRIEEHILKEHNNACEAFCDF